MNITGRGIVILNCNGTMNYFPYKDKYELFEMVSKFYVKLQLKDITIVDCDGKYVYFVDDDSDYENLFSEGWLN